MNVLVLGSGGREHALCHKLSQSALLRNLYAIPGNPGMAQYAKRIDCDAMDNKAIREVVDKYQIDLIIPGSEIYLENGIADAFEGTSTIVFGPSKKAARIESSKQFAKDLMAKYGIETAKYASFKDYDLGLAYIKKEGFPIVIKYDGLAGGKGVVVANTLEEAKEALQIMLLDKLYGDSQVIIEEYLEGPEFSLMAFVHEDTVIPMPIAQDHKRLLDDDMGPNTGGMGAYTGVDIIPSHAVEESVRDIMKKAACALMSLEAPFTGFLYGGLMLTASGPKVIEFNARFGDPEAEVILAKLDSDLLDIILKIVHKKPVNIEWSKDYYVGVVLASKGYPKAYETGFEISGIENTTSFVYHMGSTVKNKTLYTNGGRVLLVTGSGNTIHKAIEEAYTNVEKIQCQNLTYRNDIGKKSI